MTPRTVRFATTSAARGLDEEEWSVLEHFRQHHGRCSQCYLALSSDPTHLCVHGGPRATDIASYFYLDRGEICSTVDLETRRKRVSLNLPARYSFARNLLLLHKSTRPAVIVKTKAATNHADSGKDQDRQASNRSNSKTKNTPEVPQQGQYVIYVELAPTRIPITVPIRARGEILCNHCSTLIGTVGQAQK